MQVESLAGKVSGGMKLSMSGGNRGVVDGVKRYGGYRGEGLWKHGGC